MGLRRGGSELPVPVGSNSDWTLMSCGRPMGPSCSTNSKEDSSSETRGETVINNTDQLLSVWSDLTHLYCVTEFWIY